MTLNDFKQLLPKAKATFSCLLLVFYLEKIYILIDIFGDNADMKGGILPRIGLHSRPSAHAGECCSG